MFNSLDPSDEWVGGAVVGKCGAVGCISQIASGTDLPRKFLGMERLKWLPVRGSGPCAHLPRCLLWLCCLVCGAEVDALHHWAQVLGPCRLLCWAGCL